MILAASSTLICCALPALLVAIGAGSSLAFIISTIPGIIFLSKYKTLLFLITGIIIIIGYYNNRHNNIRCPNTPLKAAYCQQNQKWSNFLLKLAILLYSIGFFMAFIASHLL